VVKNLCELLFIHVVQESSMTDASAWPAPLPYDRSGAGAPLLLLHGALVDRDFWRERIPGLATAYDVIACDLPGHGAAPRLNAPTSIAAMAEAVLATMDALDLAEATIVGHSLGGMVAQELALSAPERVRALVLVDTWSRPRGYLGELLPFRTVYLHWALRAFPTAQLIELMAAGVASRTPAIAEYARQAMSSHSTDHAAFLHIWDAATDFDSHARLDQISCPTLVVASDSYIFTTVQAQRIAAGIPAARLEVIPDSGHWVSWDNPAAFDAAVLEFLREQ
jgi:3-oxoadipate enol-lactonase